MVEHRRAERHHWRLGSAAGIPQFGQRGLVAVGERLGRESPTRCGELSEVDERCSPHRATVGVILCGRALSRPRGSGGAGCTEKGGPLAAAESIVYGATPLGLALCCDATLVSPLTRTGLPQPCAAETHGAALRVAERRKRATYPELARGGPQRLVVLGAEVGGRWNGGAGMEARCGSSEICSVCARAARPPQFGKQRQRAGQEGGGACCRSLCKRPSAPLPLARRPASRQARTSRRCRWTESWSRA